MPSVGETGLNGSEIAEALRVVTELHFTGSGSVVRRSKILAFGRKTHHLRYQLERADVDSFLLVHTRRSMSLRIIKPSAL
jgi:hypothetical protein